MFFDVFSDLCARKGVSCKRAAEEIGLSNSITTKWKKTGATPGGDTLQKIAVYFGVTTDYLLGKEEKRADEGELSEDVVIYHRDGKTTKRKLTKKQMEMLAKMIDAIPEEDEG